MTSSSASSLSSITPGNNSGLSQSDKISLGIGIGVGIGVGLPAILIAYLTWKTARRSNWEFGYFHKTILQELGYQLGKSNLKN